MKLFGVTAQFTVESYADKFAADAAEAETLSVEEIRTELKRLGLKLISSIVTSASERNILAEEED